MDLVLWKEELVPDLEVATARARAGADYLDRRLGPYWDERIDLNRLDILSPFSCVLAQLSVIPGPRVWVDGGFSCGLLTDFFVVVFRFPSLVHSYELLTEAWKTLILQRRRQRQRQWRTLMQNEARTEWLAARPSKVTAELNSAAAISA